MIQDILPRYQTTADGNTNAFQVPFPLLNANAVVVYEGSTVQASSAYSVDLSTSTITFTATPAANTVITIIRSLPVSWENSLNGTIDKNSLDEAFTIITAKIQTLEEAVSRAPKTNPYDEDTGEDLSVLFIQKLNAALDSLNQAQILYTQIQSAGSQALTDISTEKTTAISDINTNASDRLGEFNSNATTKTTAFNNNANDVTDTFNTNATAKTTAFNSNATSKTSDFNSNATTKTTTFNNNATSKTSDFNSNATSKTNDFNSNAATKQAAVDASAAAAAQSETNAGNSETAAETAAASALATETRINNTLSSYVIYTDWGAGVI